MVPNTFDLISNHVIQKHILAKEGENYCGKKVPRLWCALINSKLSLEFYTHLSGFIHELFCALDLKDNDTYFYSVSLSEPVQKQPVFCQDESASIALYV